MITSYATLQTALLSEIHRPTDTALIAELPRLIQMAEADIFRELPVRDLEASVTAAVAATVALPAGLDSIERLEVTIGGLRRTLTYRTARAVETNVAGIPESYTVEGGVIRFLPEPSSGTYTLYYMPDLSALSVGNPTNWLLLNSPDVYLHAGMVQVALFTLNYAEAQRRVPLYKATLDSVRRSLERKRLPMAGGLQIKPRSAR